MIPSEQLLPSQSDHCCQIWPSWNTLGVRQFLCAVASRGLCSWCSRCGPSRSALPRGWSRSPQPYPQILCNKSPRWFVCTVKFVKSCSIHKGVHSHGSVQACLHLAQLTFQPYFLFLLCCSTAKQNTNSTWGLCASCSLNFCVRALHLCVSKPYPCFKASCRWDLFLESFWILPEGRMSPLFLNSYSIVLRCSFLRAFRTIYLILYYLPLDLNKHFWFIIQPPTVPSVIYDPWLLNIIGWINEWVNLRINAKCILLPSIFCFCLSPWQFGT